MVLLKFLSFSGILEETKSNNGWSDKRATVEHGHKNVSDRGEGRMTVAVNHMGGT